MARGFGECNSPPSAPLGLRQLAKEQYDEDRLGSLGACPFHLSFGQRLLAKESTRGSATIQKK